MVNYPLPIDNNGYNLSQDNFPLGPFDINSIFSDWSAFREDPIERNETTEANNYTEVTNFSSSSIATTTIVNLVENSSSLEESTGVLNPITEIDENAIVIGEIPEIDDNEIGVHVVNDDYPHEKFDDYGFLGLDYNFTSGVPSVQSLNTEKPITTASTTYVDSCLQGCYEIVCENKTIHKNISGTIKTISVCEKIFN